MIDKQLLEHLAGLARMGLSANELRSLEKELDSLLGHFQAIQDVDTEGVEPLTHVLTAHGVPAADMVEPFAGPRERLVDRSQSPREGFFVVPKVLEGPEAERPHEPAED